MGGCLISPMAAMQFGVQQGVCCPHALVVVLEAGAPHENMLVVLPLQTAEGAQSKLPVYIEGSGPEWCILTV